MMIIWIIGKSSAGKTEIGRRLCHGMKKIKSNTVFLDGDGLRGAIGEDLGYTKGDRYISERRTSNLCKLLSDQDINVVCAKLSNAPDIRRWNQENLTDYREIYLKVSPGILEKRDAKGLYRNFKRGDIHQVVGMDIPFIEPENPWLTIENEGQESIETIVAFLLKKLDLK